MPMHNPPHPGAFIHDIYLEPFGYSTRFLASKLGVASSTLNRIIKGQSAISPEMALRLSKVLGRSPESWLLMQDNYNLWEARKHLNLNAFERLEFDTAS